MNPRVLSKLCLLWLTLLAHAARADEDGSAPERSEEEGAQRRRITLGLRGGYGLPLGLESGGAGEQQDRELSGTVKAIVPAQVDVGLLFSSRLEVGLSFQYAPGLRAFNCPGEARCGASDLRLSLHASYHLPVSGRLSPWLGLGAGYERLKTWDRGRLGDLVADVDRSLLGTEFLHLQGGLDFIVGGPVRLGPFVTFTAGQYSLLRVRSGGERVELPVEDKAFHFWLMGGLRLQVRLPSP